MFLTVEQVAQVAHVEAKTAERWCREGRLEGARKIGHRWLIPEGVVGGAAARPAETLAALGDAGRAG